MNGCELVLDDIGFFEEFSPIEFWVGLKAETIVIGVAAFGSAVSVVKAVEAWVGVGIFRGCWLRESEYHQDRFLCGCRCEYHRLADTAGRHWRADEPR